MNHSFTALLLPQTSNKSFLLKEIISLTRNLSSMPTQNYVIDVRSDTVSLPTAEMRQAMFEAELGDDGYREDPTINKLQEKAATLFGKEVGLFVPSGIMANLLAIMVHCHQRGCEALVGDLSHAFQLEQGGAAHIGGVQLSTLKNNENGTFCLNELRRKIRLRDIHEPTTSLVIVENTHNICGGKVIPLDWLDELAAIVKEHNAGKDSRIALHMDGARIFNAAAVLQVPLARIARDFDSVCFCLSKGLSAPVGSILVGSKPFIKQAHRLRKALGGGMRQAGVLAAAGLVALETIVPCLVNDHERTKRIAEAIAKIKSRNVEVELPSVQTNILLIHLRNPKFSPRDFAERTARVEPEELLAGVTTAEKHGIVLKMFARDWEFARIVLYHQINDDDVELIIKKLEFVIKEIDCFLDN